MEPPRSRFHYFSNSLQYLPTHDAQFLCTLAGSDPSCEIYTTSYNFRFSSGKANKVRTATGRWSTLNK
uniref:Uncharacterized protein n=1 Tax=Romanomermis culicivorax TaxID=13658 RepID=A0A915HYR9_ROMCU